MDQVLLRIREVVGSGLEGDFIGGPCQMSQDQFLAGMLLLKQRFEVSRVLSAFEERVADERDAITGLSSSGRLLTTGVVAAARGAVLS